MVETDLVKMIRNLESYSLSGLDIKTLTKGQAKVILYDDLAEYRSLFNPNLLGGEYKRLIMLYRLVGGISHWVCLNLRYNNRNEAQLDFYNSYGLAPDAEIDISQHKKPKYLSILLARAMSQGIKVNNKKNKSNY